MNTTDQEQRNAPRVPADTMQRIAHRQDENIDVTIAHATGTYEQTATLRDIHQNGMCFLLTDHVLQEDDIIHINAMPGNFAFETDAIVQCTPGSCVGVDFFDSRAKNAVLPAELYTEKLLRMFQDGPEH